MQNGNGNTSPVSMTSAVTSKVKVARSRGPFDSCCPINRERKVPAETSKLVVRFPSPVTMCNKVQRLTVKVTRPNGKAYELQGWYTDGARWPMSPTSAMSPWPPRLKVMVSRSRGPSDSCWPISRERKVTEITKLVGRLRTPCAKSHQFQG